MSRADERRTHGRFAIVVISNQNYKGVRLTWFQEKLPAIAEELGVPLRVFAATEKDKVSERVFCRTCLSLYST